MDSTTGADRPSSALLPIIVLFLVGASKGYLVRRSQQEFLEVVLFETLAAIWIHSHLLPTTPSIVPWWGLVTKILARWYKTMTRETNPKQTAGQTKPFASFRSAILNGPLGPGAFKVVEVVAAIGLWRLIKKEWPAIRIFGKTRKYPGLLEWSILLGISLAVNAVLYAWSRVTKSTGTHKGVDRMVSSTKDRNNLTHTDRCLYGALAWINASCEEITFRWFWHSEFSVYLNQGGSYVSLNANAAQAAVFGVLHYHGIPSGWTGVCLAFLYGLIMGLLMEEVGDGGLFLPIVAHTITDYFVFSSVARGKAVGAKENPGTKG